MTTTLDQVRLADLERDPYPLYASLRRDEPVAWVPVLGGWLVTRWDDCERIGKDPVGWRSEIPASSTVPRTASRTIGFPNVLNSDGEVHQDLRRGIDPVLQPKPILRTIDDIVGPIARARVEAIAPLGHADLTATYFEPISVDALRHVMGLDGIVDTETLIRWFHALSLGTTNVDFVEELFEPVDRVNAEIAALIGPQLDRLRATPDGSMLSHLIHAGREDGPLRSDAEILPSLKVVLTGGMQEPGHAAATTMLGLLTNPDQLAAVTADPARIPAAIQEGLRWIAPIGITQRYAVGDQKIGGVTIPDGDQVLICLASANRDEERYDRPDAFDISRPRQSNQAFGHGAHFCAGHFFARQVERIMLEELVRALPGIRLDDDLESETWGVFFRAPKTLFARWDV